MARIAGVDLPREKRAEIGLTYIYGIGRVSANKILAAANVNPDTRVRDLTDEEVKRLSAVIDEQYMVEGDLRRDVAMNIKRLQEIGCYRGIRHRKGLPVRGQKTKLAKQPQRQAFTIDGRHVSTMAGFYEEAEQVFTCGLNWKTVSYTHLDVYKRQVLRQSTVWYLWWD